MEIPAKQDEILTTLKPEPEIEDATGLGAGVYVIIILVILIVLACIGYCVYQKFYNKKEPENKPADENDKGKFSQVPQNDPNNTETV